MELSIRNLQDKPLDDELVGSVARAAAHYKDLSLDALSLVFTDDDRITEINSQFLDRNEPTDVIAFEAERDPEGLSGEIIVSVQTAQRQAAERGHELFIELAWLIAHGVLHVAGMSDGTEDERQQMMRQQQQILKQVGLTPPS